VSATQRAVRIALVFAIAAVVHAAPPSVVRKSAFGTDNTDTWWNPSESGWGMQMVQTGSFIFTTLYVYGADGKPTWFGGGLTSTDGTTYSGKLYVTAGPWFGGPFNPASVTVREAGTMAFQATSANTGQFSYTVDGVSVSKAIERQPLTLDDYSGAYAAILTQSITGCTNASQNGTQTLAIAVQITQTSDTMYVFLANPSGDTCTAAGNYTQAGRNGRMAGGYSCQSGDQGTMTLAEMNNRTRQFSARIDQTSATTQCRGTGWLIGVVPE
jgi:hypothetical protein